MNQDNDNDHSLEDNIDMSEFAIPIESLSSSSETPEEPEGPSQPESEIDQPPSPVIGPLDEIREQLNHLSKEFESKLKYDEHKNKVIDELHQSLQEYRQGILQKYIQRIFTDVLKIVDDIRKFTAHYSNGQKADEVTGKILKFLETTAADLEDLFSWEGIVPFTCEGDQLDPSRQRVVNKVQTDDTAKDKTIAARIRAGYEWDGKVIRPEMVSIFVYQNNDATEDEKSDVQTS
jgi:molecular chaperone GrpE